MVCLPSLETQGQEGSAGPQGGGGCKTRWEAQTLLTGRPGLQAAPAGPCLRSWKIHLETGQQTPQLTAHSVLAAGGGQEIEVPGQDRPRQLLTPGLAACLGEAQEPAGGGMACTLPAASVVPQGAALCSRAQIRMDTREHACGSRRARIGPHAAQRLLCVHPCALQGSGLQG